MTNTEADLKKAIEDLHWPLLQKALALLQKENEKRSEGFIAHVNSILEEYETLGQKNAEAVDTNHEEMSKSLIALAERVNGITEGKLPTREEIDKYIMEGILEWRKTGEAKLGELSQQVVKTIKEMDSRIDRYRNEIFFHLLASTFHSLRVYLTLFPTNPGVEMNWKVVSKKDYEGLRKAGWITFLAEGDHYIAAQIFKDGKLLSTEGDFLDTFHAAKLSTVGGVAVFSKFNAKAETKYNTIKPVGPEETLGLAAARSVLKSKGFLDDDNGLTEKGVEFLQKVDQKED